MGLVHVPCMARHGYTSAGDYYSKSSSSELGVGEVMNSHPITHEELVYRRRLLRRVRAGSSTMQRTGIRFLRGGGFEFLPPGEGAGAHTGLGIDWQSSDLVLGLDEDSECETPTESNDDDTAGEDALVWR